MPRKIIFKSGEATIFASEGQYTDAMPEVLIGDVSGPVGHAFANMMAQSKGHTCMFAVRACNHQVRPATMMATKVTIQDEAYVSLFGGVVQSAIADAVVDCVIDGILPKGQVNNLCILCLVWIDPRAPKDKNLDKDELHRNNYEAMKLAVQRAMKDEPTIQQLIKTRRKVKHDMFDAASGTWY
jgi:formaldehyde-activating enzyme